MVGCWCLHGFYAVICCQKTKNSVRPDSEGWITCHYLRKKIFRIIRWSLGTQSHASSNNDILKFLANPPSVRCSGRNPGLENGERGLSLSLSLSLSVWVAHNDLCLALIYMFKNISLTMSLSTKMAGCDYKSWGFALPFPRHCDIVSFSVMEWLYSPLRRNRENEKCIEVKEGPAPIKRLRGRGCFTVAAATASALFGLLLFANGGAGVIHSKDICI